MGVPPARSTTTPRIVPPCTADACAANASQENVPRETIAQITRPSRRADAMIPGSLPQIVAEVQ
jgi:hypothetical protein